MNGGLGRAWREKANRRGLKLGARRGPFPNRRRAVAATPGFPLVGGGDDTEFPACGRPLETKGKRHGGLLITVKRWVEAFPQTPAGRGSGGGGGCCSW